MADKKQSLYEKIKSSGKNPIEAICDQIDKLKAKDSKPTKAAAKDWQL